MAEMTYNIKILRIWITIIRHGGLGHEVQELSIKCETESREE